MSETSLALIPSINKKTVIVSFVAIGWIFIVLIAATALGLLSYEETRYFHWIMSLSLPIWVLLMANPNSQNLNDKDEKIAIKVMGITFAVFVIVAIAAILQGNI
jgi:hypothetical protein